MPSLSLRRLVARRLAADWKLLAAVFAGIAVASSLVAGAPIYVNSLHRLALNTAIDQATPAYLSILAHAPYTPLRGDALEQTDRFLNRAVQDNLGEAERGTERYLKLSTLLVGLPSRPLPTVFAPSARVSRGYFQWLSNLEPHVTFIEGRMATDAVERVPGGLLVEGVLGDRLASFFEVRVGDVITLAPSPTAPERISVRIVGIIVAADPSEEYWNQSAGLFLNPAPLQEPVERGLAVDVNEPPLAVSVTFPTLVDGVGSVYPGTLATSNWFVGVDKEVLKGWSSAEIARRLDGLEVDLAVTFQGVTVITGIGPMLESLSRRGFFSTVPLLLLLAIMVATVVYYLAMMVSYLVESRAGDVALLRSRGTDIWQMVKLYCLEGAVLAAVAALVAPFLAMGAIAAAGALPYLAQFTGGGLLLVELTPAPFLVAAAMAGVALVIYVVPGAIGARTSLVTHKLRSSRPPSVPVFQRYNLDLLLLAVAGLVFWELYSRGDLVSGGLFRGMEINEALLLAPVLLLVAVALLFMRLFPLVVRFVGGESPALLHLVAVGASLALGGGIIAREVGAGAATGWVAPVAVLALFLGAYRLFHMAGRGRHRWGALALEAALAGIIALRELPPAGDALFVPAVALLLVVPLQVAFLLLRLGVRAAPVWVSVALVYMARNPLQYGWLVLLLVLVTGLGVLSTTVGGTLDRSQRERVLYDVGADIRITDVPTYLVRGNRALKEAYLAIPGVTAVSLAYRTSGKLGAGSGGLGFQVLAVESQDFPYIAWYRDDFSDRSLPEVMRSLHAADVLAPIEIPNDATRVGVWVKPAEYYPSLSLWLVVEDARGLPTTLSLGPIGGPEWKRLATDLPRGFEPPMRLLSVQVYEPVFGPVGTAGSILLDDAYAEVGPRGEVRVLEGFEGAVEWAPIVTSSISSDSIGVTDVDVHAGRRAAVFTFGKETDAGIRGLVRTRTGGMVPVVVSRAFLDATGARIGDAFVAEVGSRLVPVVITDSVVYFPTMYSAGAGFMLADMDILLRWLNTLMATSSIQANEVFIKQAPGAGDAVRDVVYAIARTESQVHDREMQAQGLRNDPLAAAGWRAMVVVAAGIILFTASLGYMVYLLSFLRRSRVEMGSLRSLGMSRTQVLCLLATEHLVMALAGLGLGTWAGFQMSRIMVSSLAVDEAGRQVVPPFILMTDWGFMAPILVSLIALLGAALLVLNRSVLRVDLQSVSRLEGP